MRRLLDILIPRFVTDRVAARRDAVGDWELICVVDDLAPGEHYDCVLDIRSLNLCGVGLFPRATHCEPGAFWA
ncbi:hypothetical protein [Thiococcus pfennigii]|uniref:hypothetical protein n=1 Tax=Thiococcus pfennigii TaxID=1057 RepID=UPI0019055097|nr:hypothetical protein [Thiococcus pfennigii]MBK1699728.1 hypothetical protein [Thiococcus pfennigii]